MNHAAGGVVGVLCHVIWHRSADISLFVSLSSGNSHAQQLYNATIFSVMRQLRYSLDETQRALDLCLLINGLPVATFELKNQLTRQAAHDAIQQYQRDRNQHELLFQFGRCLAQFAVDDNQAKFCTKLAGKDFLLLPFNKEYNDGAGNPSRPERHEDALSVDRNLTRKGTYRYRRELRADRGRAEYCGTPGPQTDQRHTQLLPPRRRTRGWRSSAMPCRPKVVGCHSVHSYTMKQAIQEGFILDVLESYTSVNSCYQPVKAVQGDSEFDVKRSS